MVAPMLYPPSLAADTFKKGPEAGLCANTPHCVVVVVGDTATVLLLKAVPVVLRWNVRDVLEFREIKQ